MKRFVCISMIISFLMTIVSGIIVWQTQATDRNGHIVLALLFTAAMLTHIILNRKRVLKRIVFIIYLVMLPVSVISGLAEAHVHPGEAGLHIVVSLIFTALMIAHIKANWKAVAYYLGRRRKAAVKAKD